MTNSSKKLITVFSVLLVFFSQQSHAADKEAGQKKSSMCVGCHGVGGISENPTFPSLAGQTNTYLINQLQAFKSGSRTSETMQSIASGLDTTAMEDLAAYFSSLEYERAGGDSELAEKGKSKTMMCMGCHGADLQGQGGFPRLAGQHPEYLAKQLNAFKKGERTGGPMGAITGNLSAKDIKEISAYLGSL